MKITIKIGQIEFTYEDNNKACYSADISTPDRGNILMSNIEKLIDKLKEVDRENFIPKGE